MRLDTQFFQKYEPDISKFIPFGFQKDDSVYHFRKELGKDDLYVSVTFDTEIHANVMDPFLEEEYIAIHLPNQQGAYVSEIREKYLQILEEIRDACFIKQDFRCSQMNVMANWIKDTFQIQPEFIFDKFPDTAVFRHADNHKWFAIEQLLSGTEFQLQDTDVETLTLKVNPKEIRHLLKQPGIYEAYHMNKKNWVTIVMNRICSDEMIQQLLTDSYNLTKDVSRQDGYWVIPANPKYYDIDHAFMVSDKLYWHASKKMKIGDTVYIYYGSPYSQIRYCCKIIETDVHFDIDDRLYMRIEKICRYEEDLLNRALLERFNVRSIRSARSVPKELVDEINRIYTEEGKVKTNE